MISSGISRDRIVKKDDGLQGILYFFDNLGSFSYSYNTGSNRRVPIFPWNWVYEQVAEFFAMFQLPTIRVIYPDFSKVSTDVLEEHFSELVNTTKHVFSLQDAEKAAEGEKAPAELIKKSQKRRVF